jgi:hypothetical protein
VLIVVVITLVVDLLGAQDKLALPLAKVNSDKVGAMAE